MFFAALKEYFERVLKNKLPASALASTPIEYIVSRISLYRDSIVADHNRSPSLLSGLTWLN